MKASTGIGIGVAFFGILLAALMEGTSPASFIDIPAIIIIFAGTGGATLASVGIENMRRIPDLYRLVIRAPEPDVPGRVSLLVSLAEQARREGLLALDQRVAEVDDDFTRKGLQLVVDGIDPDLVRDVLEAEIDGMTARHHMGAAIFDKAGGFAPTMGIIGTVMGLLHVLQNLSTPATLGPMIASAFTATLWGVMQANVFWLPMSNKLKRASDLEVRRMELILEGVLAIQAGSNPRVVEQKLLSYLSPEEQELAKDSKEAKKAAA